MDIGKATNQQTFDTTILALLYFPFHLTWCDTPLSGCLACRCEDLLLVYLKEWIADTGITTSVGKTSNQWGDWQRRHRSMEGRFCGSQSQLSRHLRVASDEWMHLDGVS